MRNKGVQMSLEDIYNEVSESMKKKGCGIVSLLEEHIDLDELIPYSFRRAFYGRMGREHLYHLDSLLWFVILKKLFGFSQNTQMINVLKCSHELRELCGFKKVPDASQITRFYQNYADHITAMFEHLVDMTEPICPLEGSKFQYLGKSGEKNRYLRFKWVYPKSIPVPKTSTRVCICDTPCTDSTYGKCVYTYLDKKFRLYPGIPRDTNHWNNLYKHRVTVERTINLLKDSFVLSDNRSFRSVRRLLAC